MSSWGEESDNMVNQVDTKDESLKKCLFPNCNKYINSDLLEFCTPAHEKLSKLPPDDVKCKFDEECKSTRFVTATGNIKPYCKYHMRDIIPNKNPINSKLGKLKEKLQQANRETEHYKILLAQKTKEVDSKDVEIAFLKQLTMRAVGGDKH